jgi:putative ABC transport system permease protein
MNALWLGELAQDGLKNLMRHKLRTVLTLLGIVFGVAAVITMLGVGEGAQRTVLREISALGLQNIILDSVKPPAGSSDSGGSTRNLFRYGLTYKDVAQIRASSGDCRLSIGHLVTDKIYAGNKRIDATVLGVTPDYFNLFETQLASGRLLTAVDNLEAKPVLLVSQAVADTMQVSGLYEKRKLRIGQKYMDIVGEITLRGNPSESVILMPYRTARNQFGTTIIKRESGSIEFTRNEVGQIVVHVPDENRVPAVARIVQRIIAANHDQPDVRVSVPLDVLRSKQRTQRILNMVLLFIAGISLLVGGIGVMNIMLAIVTERIPEIGLRRAVGARKSDILLQFLAETVVLCTLGGLLGCALGIGAILTAAHWTGWPGVITAPAILMSLGVSWVVGLLFGITPAIRAAGLDPVDALRHN